MKRFYGMVAITVFATIVAHAFAANKVEPGFQGIGGKFGEVYECAFPNTVEVDGDFGDFAWRFAGWHFVDNKTGTGPAPNEANASISFAAVADNSWLYVALRVKDDKIIRGEEPPGSSWKDDSVEIYIDPNHGETAGYEAKKGDWDAQITIPADNIGKDPNKPDLGGTGDGATTGTKAAVVETAEGWDVEAAIPLDSKNKWDIKPEDGLIIGFNIHLNDDDDGGDRDHKLIWSKKDIDDRSWTDTTRFADLQFVSLKLSVDAKHKLTTQWGKMKASRF